MRAAEGVHPLVLALLVAGISAGVSAQTSSATKIEPGAAFDTSGFPLWAKDLRRAEIITFGSFPFTFFLASTIMDTSRSASHGWDSRYAPWPFKPAGAIDMTQDEQLTVIGAAAAASVLVALVDFTLVQYKRNKARRAEAALPEGNPIIIRRPWPQEEGEEPAVPEPPVGPEAP